MGYALGTIIQLSGLAILLALFAILFLVCLWVFSAMRVRGVSAYVLAACVAGLCTLGMLGAPFTVASAGAETESHTVTFTFVLLPYTALGLTLVLLLPLLLLLTMLGRFQEKGERPFKKIERAGVRAQRREGRRKSEGRGRGLR